MNTCTKNRVAIQIPIALSDEEMWMNCIKEILNKIGKNIEQEDPLAIEKWAGDDGCFSGEAPQEIMDSLWKNLDLPAVLVQLATRYVDCLCNWLDESGEIPCGSHDLKFFLLKDGRSVQFTMPIGMLTSLWKETSQGVLKGFIDEQEYYSFGSFTPCWFNTPYRDWDEIQLGVLLRAWLAGFNVHLHELESELLLRMVEDGTVRSTILHYLDFENAKREVNEENMNAQVG